MSIARFSRFLVAVFSGLALVGGCSQMQPAGDVTGPVEPKFEFRLTAETKLELFLLGRDKAVIVFRGLFTEDKKLPLPIVISVELDPILPDYQARALVSNDDRVFITRPELGTCAVVFKGDNFVLVVPASPGSMEQIELAGGVYRGFDHRTVAWIIFRLLGTLEPLMKASVGNSCWAWLSLQNNGQSLMTAQRDERGECPPPPNPLKPSIGWK